MDAKGRTVKQTQVQRDALIKAHLAEEAKLKEKAQLNALAEKEAREKAAEAKREARKEKAAERAEARQKEMICRCRQYLDTLETQKNFENRVGQSSGFVDKVKLHDLGVLSVAVSDYLDVLNVKYPDVACEKQFSIYKQAECGSEAANLRAKLSGN